MKKKFIGNLRKGLVFVISAPAGTGKTTLARKLCAEFEPNIVESISCTTRQIRKGEIEGKDYYFLSKKEYEAKKLKDEFLEYADVFGNGYGTLKKTVLEEQNKGKHVILVIDTQGALQLKNVFPAIFIFISPPTKKELEKRLKNRQTESQEILEKRLSWAEKEMETIKFYDYHIVNDDLDIAYEVLKSIISAEEHKIKEGK